VTSFESATSPNHLGKAAFEKYVTFRATVMNHSIIHDYGAKLSKCVEMCKFFFFFFHFPSPNGQKLAVFHGKNG
jgi:hypothetical protein